MIFTFHINPDYIFLHAINMAQINEPFDGWGDFTNSIWEEDHEIFYFLAGTWEYSLYGKNLIDIAQKGFLKLEEIREDPRLLRLVKETEEYKIFIEKQWKQNESFILEQLKSFWVLVSEKRPSIDVFLTHPKLKNGLTIDNGKIAWGHEEDFKNYSSVYLSHELLHILTQNDPSNVTHAIIELMTDNEMRIRLNGYGTYFEFKGHSYLKELEESIYPHWKEFLKKPWSDFYSFIKDLKKMWLN